MNSIGLKIRQIALPACLGVLVGLGVFWKTPSTTPPPGNRYFFNGKTYMDTRLMFGDIQSMGARDSMYRMEFAYEDYLKTIPPEMREYKNIVKILSIVHGEVRTIPDWIGDLSRLEQIILLDQPITSLPASIGSLDSLKSLTISGGLLSAVPDTIGNATNLEVLRLDDNRLTNLPETIGNLKNLQVLDVHGNRLTSLPETIKQLKKLKYVYIGGNSFSPEEIEKIKTLLPAAQIYY